MKKITSRNFVAAENLGPLGYLIFRKFNSLVLSEGQYLTGKIINLIRELRSINKIKDNDRPVKIQMGISVREIMVGICEMKAAGYLLLDNGHFQMTEKYKSMFNC